MKILWMVPKWTLPVNDGAKVATDSLIANTARAGAIIDVLCFSPLEETGEADELRSRWNIRNVFKVSRPSPPAGHKKYFYHLKNLLLNPHIPLTFTPYLDKRAVERLRQIINGDDYDYILLDGLHLGTAFLNGLVSTSAKIIYRAHNIERDLWTRSRDETQNPVFKILFHHQSNLVERIEKGVIRLSKGVAPISQEDADIIKSFSIHDKLKLVPLGLNFEKKMQNPVSEKIQFLFIGKLDWAPNKDGLKWLLDNVWDEVAARRPDAALKIVGSGDHNWLKPYLGKKGINFVGYVNKIEDAYEDVHFAVVPVYYGSGTRIKVIEAFVMNRRLISTKMGVQGADLRDQDYECCETREEWINTLSTIAFTSDTIQKVKESREYMKDVFCEKKIGSSFYNWLCEVS